MKRSNDITVINKFIKHFGIISTLFKETRLVEHYDQLLPKNRDHFISHGEAILAFVLNGLSFGPRQLYKFEDFFKTCSLSKIFGRELKSEYINEAVMGELLDKIYDFGPTELFLQTIKKIMQYNEIDFSYCHTDTTSFSVYGAYEKNDLVDPEAIEITFGPSKDKRKDLKRYALSVIANSKGIPVFMESNSGNSSDRKKLKIAMETIKKDLIDHLGESKKIYYIADSAFYNKKGILDFGVLWVSRVPENLNEAKNLLKVEEENLIQVKTDHRYSYFEAESNYGNVDQKWVLIYSSEMDKKQRLTFNIRLTKQLEKATKSLKKFKGKKFDTAEKGHEEANNWISKYDLLRYKNFDLKVQKRRAKGLKGRPKEDEKMEEFFRIDTDIEINTELVDEIIRTEGRFIIASNDKSLSGEEMLRIYKEQSSVEKCFRFLKSRNFQLHYTFLNKPERIESLAFLIVLCLLIYSLLEVKMREGMAKQKTTVPKMKHKKTKKPTFEAVIEFFNTLEDFTIKSKDKSTISCTSIERNHPMWTVLKSLGPKYVEFYEEHLDNAI
ncbi:MAG: IS1634 family transposase [Fusobacteriaceae bacterium]|jgi:transposase|nr:IS1634 family transposase [Fusobacteriaceae bacterium]